MKYIKNFESATNRKVYWIIPFISPKFEDSIVKLMSQYTPKDDEDDYVFKIEIIDKALGIANNVKKALKEDDICILTMTFSIEHDKWGYEKITKGPDFSVYSIDDKKYLDEDKYIFIGFHNMTEKDYDFYKSKNKYNL